MMKRAGLRYFSMHRLTGAELTKLIAVKLFDSGMPGTEIYSDPALNDGAY